MGYAIRQPERLQGCHAGWSRGWQRIRPARSKPPGRSHVVQIVPVLLPGNTHPGIDRVLALRSLKGMRPAVEGAIHGTCKCVAHVLRAQSARELEFLGCAVGRLAEYGSLSVREVRVAGI